MKKNVTLGGAPTTAGPTIWIIGDSTVASYSKDLYPLSGWGQQLYLYCNPGVKIDNRAVSGHSTRSFLDEGHWDKMLPLMKKGDFLLIQFGHNDMKKKRPKVYAPVDTLYQELLKKYIAEAQGKGVSTVLVTSVCRRVFKNGRLRRTLGKYPEAIKKVAKETEISMIDLNAISREKYIALGDQESKKLFMHLEPGISKQYPKGRVDNSHLRIEGSKKVAAWVVADAKKQNLPIAKLFKE